MRRDRHRAGRGRPADPRQRRREPGRAPRRRPAGSCPRSRRGPTCAGSCRCSTRRSRAPGATVADVDAVAVTSGPGLAGSLLVGHQLREDARLGARQAARRRSTTSRATSTRAGCSTRARTEREAPAVPARRAGRVGRAHVPRRDARPPHVPAAGHDRRRRRGRGVRQGGPAAGPRLPGRARRSAPAADARRPRTTGVFPRAWMGDSYDFSFSGLKTAARRIIAEARAEAGLPADDERDGAAPRRRSLAELAWGFQDAVVDVLATKTIRAAEETGGARGSCSAAGVAANDGAPGADRGRGRGARDRVRHPAARAVHRQRRDDRRRRRAAPGRGRPRGARARRDADLAAARRSAAMSRR